MSNLTNNLVKVETPQKIYYVPTSVDYLLMGSMHLSHQAYYVTDKETNILQKSRFPIEELLDQFVM